ncbi:MAG: penicillin-binding protein 1A [Gammaproteobacteria bacterium]
MKLSRTARFLLYTLLLGSLVATLLVVVLYVKIESNLPSIDVLKEVKLQEPLRIYTHDRKLLAEFGDKRRVPVSIDQVPESMIHAFLAAEDDRFFQHSGVDFPGLLRAVVELITTGEKRSGGSTITMQMARNFFLPTEKTYLRKLTEIMLAFRIEKSLSKNEILELYLNKIYLGNRAYGVEAAARVYYGKGISDISLAQVAMIAALPKAPSRINPLNDAEAATARRNYILGRMHRLGYIDEATLDAAIDEVDQASLHKVRSGASAAYLAEMARNEMVQRYGRSVYTAGYEVVTSIDAVKQAAANLALRKALLDYSKRHGYRGPEARVNPEEYDEAAFSKLLAGYPVIGGLAAAVVTGTDEKTATAVLASSEVITIEWQGLAWARPYVNENRMGKSPRLAADVLAPGDVIRVLQAVDGSWQLAQVPVVEGALVSLRPEDGAIQALVGGFDFSRSKFNRVTQARRQPGSSFKPVIYSAALDKGFTAATLINDAPVVFDDPALESTWRPENYSGQFYGPTRMREALYRSRNLVSIRILRKIGINYVVGYAERFGFSRDQMPRDLTLALGSAAVSPMQMARAYAALANGGYLIEPWFIKSIQDPDGNEVFRANPPLVCPDCPPPLEPIDAAAALESSAAKQVMSPQTVWLMTSMMQDVIQRGTGKQARVLNRSDLAGKTGTTNDQNDAWFCGFNYSQVAVAWVGFDKLAPLGRKETGGKAALPMWIDYMRAALAGVKQRRAEPPQGLVTVRIDPASGLLAGSGQSDAIFETFREESVPQQTSDMAAITERGGVQAGGLTEQLF